MLATRVIKPVLAIMKYNSITLLLILSLKFLSLTEIYLLNLKMKLLRLLMVMNLSLILTTFPSFSPLAIMISLVMMSQLESLFSLNYLLHP